jgi:hypothetical protein
MLEKIKFFNRSFGIITLHRRINRKAQININLICLIK